MAQRWILKAAMMMTLLAFVVMHMIDLAVLDADHDHGVRPHMEMHIAEIAHDHTPDELSEHDSLATMSMHLAFHVLLGSFIDAPDLEVELAALPATVYRRVKNESALTEVLSPPVPPPLYRSL